MVTKDFLKATFSGNKRLMKMKKAEFITIPKYDELSVKNLYDKFLLYDGFKDYFPDSYPKNR